MKTITERNLHDMNIVAVAQATGRAEGTLVVVLDTSGLVTGALTILVVSPTFSLFRKRYHISYSETFRDYENMTTATDKFYELTGQMFHRVALNHAKMDLSFK